MMREGVVAALQAELRDVPRRVDLPRPDPAPDEAERVFSLPARVFELAARRGCTPESVVLAAWFAILHRYSSQDAVLVGVTWVPVVSRIVPGTSFLDVLDSVVRQLDRAAELPARVLAELLGPRDTALYHVGFGAGTDAELLLLLDGQELKVPGRASMTRHLVTLLGSACAEPSIALSRLRMLTDAETLELLALGGTGESEAPTRTLAATVTEHARTSPERLALTRGGETLTYGELDRSANQLARYLADHGVRRGLVVGLLLDRSPEWLITVLAAFKLGAVPLPLDPRVPAPRVAEALRVTPPAVTVCLERLRGNVPDGAGGLLPIDRDRDEIKSEVDNAFGVGVELEDLAYVVQTSGSTGVPKAIGGPHRVLAHAGLHAARMNRTTPRDRVAWLIPPSAAIGFYVLAEALTAGASLHIAEPDLVANPPALRDWLAAEGITQVLAITPVAEALAALPWPPDVPLRMMTAAGERLRHWGSVDLPFDVGVLYGCAEAFMIADSFQPWPQRVTSATATDQDRASAPPVGRPTPGVRVLLVDRDLNLVPAGAVGEVLVSTPQLSLGYLSDPAATAAKFLPDPYGPPGGRLYRTGDLARFRPDGLLEHRGRIDSMVKIRGYRIEVADVERVLLGHRCVAEVVVVPGTGREGRTELVACVALSAPATAGQLREYLTERLPEYMVPSAYPVLERLPRNAADKIDRAALPPAGWHNARAGRTYRAPRDETEERVVAMWQELLGLDRVGIDDHFLELGGDSLLASRLRARTREQWGVEIGQREMLVRATPTEIAQLLRERAGRVATRVFPPVTPDQEATA
jgi:amino acid adenylation domain-containing protein